MRGAICNGCRQEIDPEVCGCGSDEGDTEHGGSVESYTHPFIPMGCNCYRIVGHDATAYTSWPWDVQYDPRPQIYEARPPVLSPAEMAQVIHDVLGGVAAALRWATQHNPFGKGAPAPLLAKPTVEPEAIADPVDRRGRTWRARRLRLA